jgi:lipid II:glycine glycyltransferase (peptidoglycan interpeptide bridge formation enzyme)
MPQQLELLQNLGSLEQAGSVVYIDLNVPPEMQLVKYNKRLRTQVNKSRRNCRIYRAENADEILEFKKMYYQNMDRVNARKTYYFSADYFQELNECKEFNVRYYLIEERESKEIIGGGILLQHNHMAQYHLSGTRDGFQYLSPTKLLIDQMRQDASEAGAKYFNLGGGIGGSRDNLFRFKSLFSNDYKSFYLWKYIVNPAVYVELNRRDNKTKNHKYFPTYRS